jgi:ketol-acid reductoisomerase
VGLFGDGATYTQLFCLLFTFWSFGAALALCLFLYHPKRLQWFYDIVGEKRVKPLLFQNPTAKSLFFRTVPVILGLITLDGINDMGCEHKHHNSKVASLNDAEKAAKLLQDEAQERYTNHLQQTENQEENKAITTAYIEEDKEIRKQLYGTSDKIHATERTTQSFLKGVMRSESSRQVIGAVERIGTSVFGY